MKFGSESLESAHRARIAIRRQRHHVLFGSDINACRIHVKNGETLQINPFAGFGLLSAHNWLG
jgi:hypothetical protein